MGNHALSVFAPRTATLRRRGTLVRIVTASGSANTRCKLPLIQTLRRLRRTLRLARTGRTAFRSGRYRGAKRIRLFLFNAVLNRKQKIEILSMMDDAILFVDGPHLAYPVKRGSRIVIWNANRPITAIW